MRTTLASALALGFFILTNPALGNATILTETAQKSIVYILYDAIDPNTGAKSRIQGSGFVISPKGYVLTASHLFRAWKAQRLVDKANNPIRATLRDKFGYVRESPLVLNSINIGDPDQEDVALLKLPDQSLDYQSAPICFRQADAARVGDQLMAFGFPRNQNFQPVPAWLGTQNAPGGRWAAASAFTEGMSGGPVYNLQGFVVGMVKGGLDINAVNWITPIRHANSLLGAAGFVEQCQCARVACRPPVPTSEASSLMRQYLGAALGDQRSNRSGLVQVTLDLTPYGLNNVGIYDKSTIILAEAREYNEVSKVVELYSRLGSDDISLIIATTSYGWTWGANDKYLYDVLEKILSAMGFPRKFDLSVSTTQVSQQQRGTYSVDGKNYTKFVCSATKIITSPVFRDASMTSRLIERNDIEHIPGNNTPCNFYSFATLKKANNGNLAMDSTKTRIYLTNEN